MAIGLDIVANVLQGVEGMVALGVLDKAMPDTDYTLLATEYIKPVQNYTGALGAGRNVIEPLQAGAVIIVYNGTTGGFALTFKGASGTGIAVAATKRAILMSDGVNWIRVTPDT